MATAGDGSKSSKTPAPGKAKGQTQEQIVAGFQELRNQQRATASKMSEIEMDRKEHEYVYEAGDNKGSYDLFITSTTPTADLFDRINDEKFLSTSPVKLVTDTRHDVNTI